MKHEAETVTNRIVGLLSAERLRPFLFAIAGGLSVPVNLASRVLLSVVLRFEVAIVLSHFCGMMAAFVLNKLFVFEPSGRAVGSELFRFTLVNLVSLAQAWVVAVGLVKFLLPALNITFHPELLGHFVGLATTVVTSYIGHKELSFARRK